MLKAWWLLLRSLCCVCEVFLINPTDDKHPLSSPLSAFLFLEALCLSDFLCGLIWKCFGNTSWEDFRLRYFKVRFQSIGNINVFSAG